MTSKTILTSFMYLFQLQKLADNENIYTHSGKDCCCLLCGKAKLRKF